MQLDTYLLIMFFAFLHECGHILAGVLLKFKIQSLKIMPIGFHVTFRIDTRNYNKKILHANLLAIKKIIIAFAGPIVNLIFILIFSLMKSEMLLGIKIETLIYVNILIFMFNMITIYPLDGGRILKNLLHILFGKLISLKVTKYISNFVTFLISIICIYISVISKNFAYIIVICYIWILVLKMNKVYDMKIKIYKILKEELYNVM